MDTGKLKLLDWRSQRVVMLHLSWFAFFVSFLMWFNHAPLMLYIKAYFALSDAEVKTLLILNVALTIPARNLVGMFVDRYGPRLMYSLLLAIGSLLCFAFALATDFAWLALCRFLLGFVGASFVIGIRLIAEWFPARQLGIAEGIYGGWGNFGAAVGALLLPALALAYGGDEGWRWAVATTGLIALIYSGLFYRYARDTPVGQTYFRPNRLGAIEVSTRKDMVLYILTMSGLYLGLGLLVWRLSTPPTQFLSQPVMGLLYFGLALLFLMQVRRIVNINDHLRDDARPPVQYAFKQVGILSLAYLAAFGAELSVVSMLPLHFHELFGLEPIWAAALASSFAFMNLIARPLGGHFSDRYGRKRTLTMVFLGTTLGFLGFASMNGAWPMPLAVLVTIVCSFFVQAGCGAVFACIPLIQRRLTGQFSGVVGAYGNVGGLLFLTILSVGAPSVFFLALAAAAMLSFLLVQFYDEPKGHMVEVLPDGRVHYIAVE